MAKGFKDTTKTPPPAPQATLEVMDKPNYNIIIDLDRSKLTWGDLILLGSMEGNEDRQLSGKDLVRMGKLFNHVIVGGVEDLPLDATGDIIRALNLALKADSETKN